jgi:outer membrane lipoprotein-sorting protein
MGFILALFALVPDDAAKEALRGIREAIASAKTISVSFAIEGSVTKTGEGTTKLSGSGSIQFKEDNKAAVRMNMLREKGEQVFILISDGKHLMYDVGDKWNKLGKIDRKGGVRPSPELLSIVLKDSWASGNLVPWAYESSAGGTDVKGLDPKAFESPTLPRISEIKGGEDEGDSKTMTYKLNAGDKAFDVRLWYDAKTQKASKRVVHSKSEEVEITFTENFSEYTLNAELPDEKFKLKDPPDKPK